MLGRWPSERAHQFDRVPHDPLGGVEISLLPVNLPSRTRAVAAIALPLGTALSVKSLLRTISCSWSSAV